MAPATIRVNGDDRSVDVPPDTALLWVLRDVLGLTGTKYGCGIGVCGACTVHMDGVPIRSCTTPMSAVRAEITTIEGIGARRRHALQDAWLAEQVPQCGYCQSGQIMHAVALLATTPAPTREDVVAAMNPVICRCGTYLRIVRAVLRAADGGRSA